MFKRAQVAVEFLSLLSLIIGLLVVFSLVSYYRQVEINQLKLIVASESLCSAVASEINAAVMVGDGYERSFLLPAYLADGTPYSAEVSGLERRVLIFFEGGGCQKPILTSQVAGNEILVNGLNVVNNTGGVVYLNA